MNDELSKRAIDARRLIRARDHAALATSLDGWPYASLVAVACDIDASPLLLLSDLAQHTSNLADDPRISLLFEDTSGYVTLRGASSHEGSRFCSVEEQSRAKVEILRRFAPQNDMSQLVVSHRT